MLPFLLIEGIETFRLGDSPSQEWTREEEKFRIGHNYTGSDSRTLMLSS